MGKKGASVWDIIAWLALIGIGVWVLLKVFGVIKTPLFIEYALIGGAVYIAGWAMHKLDRATDDIKEVTHKLDMATDDIKDVKNNLKTIEFDMVKIRMNCPALLKK
jgi:hypothetical protein